MSAKCALGKAIHYGLNQWPESSHYVEGSRLNIDNNRAERAVKPFVIGCNNWLFNHNQRGAEASATSIASYPRTLNLARCRSPDAHLQPNHDGERNSYPCIFIATRFLFRQHARRTTRPQQW
ncbi:IS66 family transposase [Shewanella sp.]|nr:IS66 family transposase [Shewanella sp.]